MIILIIKEFCEKAFDKNEEEPIYCYYQKFTITLMDCYSNNPDTILININYVTTQNCYFVVLQEIELFLHYLNDLYKATKILLTQFHSSTNNQQFLSIQKRQHTQVMLNFCSLKMNVFNKLNHPICKYNRMK